MATEQEILEFVIKLKMEEMKRGLNATEQEIRDFHGKAARDFKATSAEVAKLEESGKKLSKEFDKSTKTMEQSLKGLQTAATVSLAAITASAGLTMKTFADFQTQLNSLESVSGATAAQMDALEGKAKSLGESTKYSASQMAETSVELSKLGFVSEEIIASIDGIVSAAAASGVSLAEAGELVAGTVRGFGLDASEAVKVADVLASAANASALSMGDLSLSMKYVAPIAAASNQSLTDMTGIMGILANNMIRGEQAGTSLRAMMARLQNPSSEMSDIMKKLGLEIEGADGKMKRMPVILGELRDKMSGLKDTTKSRVLGELFGTEALSAASVLMNTSNEQLGEMIRKMEDSSGASKEMADIMQKGVNHELDILKSKAESVAIAFGEQMAPGVEEAIKKLGNFLDLINQIPDPVKKTTTDIAFLGGAIAGLGLALAGSIGGGKKLLNILKDLAAVGAKAPWLAAFLGTAALPVTIATIGSIGIGNLQGSANDLNDEADSTDLDRTQGQGVKALSDANAQLRKSYERELAEIVKLKAQYERELTGAALDKALAGLAKRQAKAAELLGDVSVLGQEQLKTSLGNIRQARTSLENELNNLKSQPEKLRALQKELDKALSGYQRGSNITTLQKQIASINLVQVNKDIRATQAQLQRINTMDEKFSAALKKRDAEIKNNKATPDPALENALSAEAKDARDAAEKAQKLKTQTFFNGVDQRLQAEKDALDRTKALKIQNAQDIVQVDDAMSEKLVKNARNTAREEGQCFKAVYDSYIKTFGDKGKGFALMTGGKGSGRNPMDAADAANVLPYDDRFEEVKINASNYKEVLKNAKSTAVIIYDRSSGFSATHGHSEVYDPKTGMAYYGRGAINRRDTMTPKQADHARMFVLKGGSPDTENIAAKEALIKLQKVYNKEIQGAIAYQAMLPKQSESYRIAEERIVKLKQDAGKLGIDLIEAETAARKKVAEAAQKIAEKQKEEFLSSLKEVASFSNSLTTRSADLQKQIAQESMTPLQKMVDDFDREIADYQKKAAELNGDAIAANVTQEQRKIILGDIGKLNDKILGVQKDQQKLITSAEAKEALRKKYEAMEDEIAAELRAVDAKKRKLALEVQLGQLSPEDRAKRLLEINNEELEILDKRLKKEQAMAADRNFNDEQRKSAAERALLIEGQIADTTNQQLVIAHELGEVRRQEYLQIQSTLANGLITSLDTMGKMVGFSENIGSNFRSVLNAVLEINNNLQTVTSTKGKDGNITQTLGRTDILKSLMGGNLTKDLSVSPGVVAGMVGFSAQALLAATNLYADFYESLRGDQSQMIESTIAFNREMATVELSAAELRLSQAREKGQETLDLELDIIEKRRKMRESEIDDAFFQLSTVRTGFLGLGYSATDRFKQSLFIKSAAEQRVQIEEETNAEIEQARKAHINRLIDDATSSRMSTEDNELRRAELKALQTDDPLDDLEVERTRRKTQAVREYISELDRISKLQISHEQKNALMGDEKDILNDEVAYIESDIDDKRKKAREDLNKTKEVTIGLLEEENALLRAQRTADPYDDLYAAADKELKENQRAMEQALAQEGLTEEQKQKIRNHYRELELTARHKFQKALSDLQKSELQRVTDDYKTLLQQQATLIREGVEAESEKYQNLIDTEETKLKAAEDRVKAEQEKLEELRKKRENELQAFDPEDGVQSAAFRKDMAAYDPSAAAYKGVDELSNVDNRDSLGTVSGETKRKGLIEQADLTEFAAKNAFRKEEITKGDFVKRMQEAQLMRAKAAEMELAEDGLTTRRKLELEEEWANAYETYQDLARQAIDARYDVEEQRINANIAKHEEEAVGYQKTIDGYQSSIDKMSKAADEKIKPIEDAIKAAERSTRNWAGAWDDVTDGIKAAMAALERDKANATAASSYSGGSYNPYGSSVVAAKPSYNPYGSTVVPAKMATGGTVPPGFPNDTYPAWLSSGETVTPPLPLSEMRPAGTVNNITQNRYVTISGNHIQSNVDMYGVAMDAIRDNELETQRNFGTQAGRWA